MKQIEATPARPFYSVGYQYKSNPWTVWTCHRFDKTPLKMGGNYRTMEGTDDKALAIRTADLCAKEPGIAFAWVHVSTDCYNHQEIYKAVNPD